MSKFKEPKINLNKIYTKSGDTGKTSLIGSQKVYKNDIRVEAYGSVDELNVIVGICVNHIKKSEDKKIIEFTINRLSSIQNELFNLGTTLASIDSVDNMPLPAIQKEDIILLEEDIDFMNTDLDPLKSFILPSGNDLILSIHLARTICRRCERISVSVYNKHTTLDVNVIKYLNRLSDYFFVLSRWVGKIYRFQETLWSPNNITSIKEK